MRKNRTAGGSRLASALAVAFCARACGAPGQAGGLPWSVSLARARELTRVGDFDRARELLLGAMRKMPWIEPLEAELGLCHWKLGDRGDAILAWQVARALDPEGLGAALLRGTNPRLAVEKHLVRTPDEFVELARVLVDFRRQRELEAGLKALAVSKGLSGVTLPSGSIDAVTAELVEAGFLERPGGPPSGRGSYRVALDGTVWSTTFGGPGALKDPPPALAHAGGFVVPPRVVIDALLLGGPEVVEVGVHFLSNRELGVHGVKLGQAITVTKDPWAIDALLDRLDQAAEDRAFKGARGLVAGLRHVFAVGERRARFRALGWLDRVGESELPRLSGNELDELLAAAAHQRVRPEAVAAALKSMGAGADEALAAVLRAAKGRAFTVALEHAPRAGAGETAKVLIAGLDSKDEVWMMGAPAARRALVAMAGGDEGQKPGGWPRWWVRRYGR